MHSHDATVMPDRSAWSPPQLARLKRSQLERSVDVHCHCLPGIDDGPADLASAVELCQALAADGITSVIASPHQLGKYDLANSAEVIRRRLEELNEALDASRVPLEVVPGGDVRIDERLVRLVADGDVFTCGDLGRHLLLELPNSSYCEPRPLIEQLAAGGIQTIMTHPERHRYLGGNLDIVASWVRGGAVVQVTAGSLLGDFGRSAFDFAWRMLQHGLVQLVATDAHHVTRRPPRLTAAWSAIESHLGPDLAQLVCGANPLRVWRGQSIEALG